MKKLAILCVLLVSVPLLYGQKTRYGEGLPKARPGVAYPIKIHVSGIRLRSYCNTGVCYYTLYAGATLNGEKVELSGGMIYQSSQSVVTLVPGDYQARLLKESHKVAGTPLFDEYEVVLPDRSVLRCSVTGFSE